MINYLDFNLSGLQKIKNLKFIVPDYVYYKESGLCPLGQFFKMLTIIGDKEFIIFNPEDKDNVFNLFCSLKILLISIDEQIVIDVIGDYKEYQGNRYEEFWNTLKTQLK